MPRFVKGSPEAKTHMAKLRASKVSSASKVLSVSKKPKKIKGGVIQNWLLLLPNAAFLNVLRNLNYAELSNARDSFLNEINEGQLTPDELALVTNKLDIINYQIDNFIRAGTPPSSPKKMIEIVLHLLQVRKINLEILIFHLYNMLLFYIKYKIVFI